MSNRTAAVHQLGLTARAEPVYTRLQELIVRGRLAPGVRITEASVAEWLGVSRTPVREAMQRLRGERLLVATGPEPAGRTRLAVAPLVREQMEELYALAGALEGVAARSIADTPTRERKALAAVLTRAERAFDRAAKRTRPDYDQLFELHDAFHRHLINASAGPETLALLNTVRPQLDRYEWYYAPLVGPNHNRTHVEHMQIVASVEDGTAADIESAVRANWSNGAERLKPVLKRAQESGLPKSLTMTTLGLTRG